MKNFKLLIIFLSSLFIFTGCQTIKKKTDSIVDKENQRLSQFIGKSTEVLKIDLGNPNEDYKNEKGNLELVYKTKKYGIVCERRFEIDSNSIIIGFVSNGCF